MLNAFQGFNLSVKLFCSIYDLLLLFQRGWELNRHFSNFFKVQIWHTNTFETFVLEIPAGVLKTGANVLAIEGHNDDLDSSDFTLNPSLYLEPAPTPP